VDKEATELVLAAVSQANQLASILNDSLNVTEEEAVTATSEVFPGSSPRLGRRIDRLPGVPAHKSHSISKALKAKLTQLLKIVKDRDEEREKLSRELQRSREQLHVLLQSDRRKQLNASSSPSHIQPSSLISQEGPCELHQDREDDTGLNKSALKGEHDNKVIDVCDLGTEKHSMSEQRDDTGPEVFVHVLTGETDSNLEGEPELLNKAAEGLGN
jgi:DNA gyrase/topoisomerase IV subunit A